MKKILSLAAMAMLILAAASCANNTDSKDSVVTDSIVVEDDAIEAVADTADIDTVITLVEAVTADLSE